MPEFVFRHKRIIANIGDENGKKSYIKVTGK
jgi:hypothetical protein